MKFEHTKVYNFDGALRGLRNPLESWHKSDSYFGSAEAIYLTDYNIASSWCKYEHPELYEDIDDCAVKIAELEEKYRIQLRAQNTHTGEVVLIGPNDMQLARNLIYGGGEHRKFLRQIFVSVDITSPIYWWKEFDTYKIATTANSTSTMHKLASTPITIDCFEIGDMQNLALDDSHDVTEIVFSNDIVAAFIDFLESLRVRYLETKDKSYWKELIRWLPESWLQTRTITMNYEVIRSICKQRKGHKLSEWAKFIEWAKDLPYARQLIFEDGKEYHSFIE